MTAAPCFIADDARLMLTDAAVPGCAAEAALALARLEPLLAVLDGWCEHAGVRLFDWAWGEAPPAESPTGARARWPAHGDALAELHLPWPLLRRLGAPPEALTKQLAWHDAPARLVLAELVLSGEDEAALEPGALLLLAPSFDAHWRGRLQPAGEPGNAAWRVDAEAGAQPVAALCGWPGASDAPAPPAQLQLRHGETLRAHGRLLPWGRGHALLIEQA